MDAWSGVGTGIVGGVFTGLTVLLAWMLANRSSRAATLGQRAHDACLHLARATERFLHHVRPSDGPVDSHAIVVLAAQAEWAASFQLDIAFIRAFDPNHWPAIAYLCDGVPERVDAYVSALRSSAASRGVDDSLVKLPERKELSDRLIDLNTALATWVTAPETLPCGDDELTIEDGLESLGLLPAPILLGEPGYLGPPKQ